MEEQNESGEGEASNLSPAQIEELQRKNCVFCHIASGRVPARKVYEDEECLGILDINPATAGHVLLMPKEHYTVMFQAPEGLIEHLMAVAKGLSQAGLKAFQSKGTTIFAANGISAGQRAPHFMLHVIPRLPGDNIGLYIPTRTIPEAESGRIMGAISKAMGWKGVEGKKEEKQPEKAEEKKPTEKKEEQKQGKSSDLDEITDFLAKGAK